MTGPNLCHRCGRRHAASSPCAGWAAATQGAGPESTARQTPAAPTPPSGLRGAAQRQADAAEAAAVREYVRRFRPGTAPA